MPKVIEPILRLRHPKIDAWRQKPMVFLMVSDWLTISVADKRHLIAISGGPSWCDIPGSRTFGFIHREKMQNFARAVRLYHLRTEEIAYAR